MKMIMAAVGISLLLMSGLAVAAESEPPGHCKETKSQVCGQDMTAMSHHDHSGHGGGHEGHGSSQAKLDWAGMSGHMVPMMKTISGMGQKLAEMMGPGMKGEKMAEIGEIMDDMSTQMLRMADAMRNGGASEAEMHSIHMGIDDASRKLEKIK